MTSDGVKPEIQCSFGCFYFALLR